MKKLMYSSQASVMRKSSVALTVLALTLGVASIESAFATDPTAPVAPNKIDATKIDANTITAPTVPTVPTVLAPPADGSNAIVP